VTGCAVTCYGLNFYKLLIINICDCVTGVQGGPGKDMGLSIGITIRVNRQADR
jgi:hypothetical protein